MKPLYSAMTAISGIDQNSHLHPACGFFRVRNDGAVRAGFLT